MKLTSSQSFFYSVSLRDCPRAGSSSASNISTLLAQVGFTERSVPGEKLRKQNNLIEPE